MKQVYDCAIVGGGPAGLYCAVYLGRYIRKSIVFRSGRPRASWIPATHNFPTHPGGISGKEILRLLEAHARRYSVDFHEAFVTSITGEDGGFKVTTDDIGVAARKIVIATGVSDIPPDIPDPEHYKGRTIRHCPVCDAYETRNKRTVVIGPGDHAAKEAVWLRHYTNDIALLLNGSPESDISAEFKAELDRLGIPVFPAKITEIRERDSQLGDILLSDGSSIDRVFRGYSAMGLKANNSLAVSMGLPLDEGGFIVTDRDMRTSVPGVYSIGDVVSGELAQLSTAFGHAAAAAINIHNNLD